MSATPTLNHRRVIEILRALNVPVEGVSGDTLDTLAIVPAPSSATMATVRQQYTASAEDTLTAARLVRKKVLDDYLALTGRPTLDQVNTALRAIIETLNDRGR